MAFEIEDIVGDYRVVGIIGAGGTGTVYKVEHRITRRIEALKAFSTGLGISDDEVLRFEREIQVQARMQHPNIAAVYSAIRHGDWLALVMEYVEGESLRARLERERLPISAAIAIASDVLGALGCAHRNGIVHGDVSPANIMLAQSGVAKLTDFGIAREREDLDPGTPVGTPAYMSPEQVRGLAVDVRSDIYAAGAVLYEMLTGRKLFEADTSFGMLRAQVEQTPKAPREIDRRIPPALDVLVMRALAKDPARRFQTAAEFRDALTALAAPGRRLRPVLTAFAAAVALAACSGALIIRSNRIVSPAPIPATPPPAAREAAPPAPIAPVVADPVVVDAPIDIPPARRAEPRHTEAELKPRTVHHMAAAPTTEVEPSTQPAAPLEQSSPRRPVATDANPATLPDISHLPAVESAPVPIAVPDPPKAPPKQGNRFVRALGKINPFRHASKDDDKQP